MAAQADVDAVIAEARATNATVICELATMNANYRAEWKKLNSIVVVVMIVLMDHHG